MTLKLYKVFCAVFFTFAILLIAISLISYNPADPCLFYDSSQYALIQNRAGFVGANVAATLLYFFGFSCILLIPLLCLSLITIFKQESFQEYVSRIIALILLIPLNCALANINAFEFFQTVYPGGLVGKYMHYMLVRCFDTAYLHIFIFLSCWALLIMVLRFSFIRFFYPLFLLLRPLGYVIKFVLQSAYLIAAYLQINIKAILLKFKDEKLIEDRFGENSQIFNDPFWMDQFENFDLKNIVIPQMQEDLEPQELPIELEEEDPQEDYALPQKLYTSEPEEIEFDSICKQESENRAQILEAKLERFGIKGKVISITNGPVVTLFEYQPSIDTKISQILAREDDLALALQAMSLRIIAPIPGKSVVGFEVAHNNRQAVLFSNIISSRTLFKENKYGLPLVLGKDTIGSNIVIDLARMPHLLVAGSTGSGKSVGLNSMLMSLLCTKSPEMVKLILIDPKRLEFSTYSDLAHLLFPIITEPQKAIKVLKWAVITMQERYEKMAQLGIRNIDDFHKLYSIKEMPYIVIMIDELADLMLTGGKEVENAITRLAQMARASGIHLILATQRPSVDIITGLIKVNFPSRIAFKVTSKVDSRTIIDCMGAEKLLGKGDMLFLDSSGIT